MIKTLLHQYYNKLRQLSVAKQRIQDSVRRERTEVFTQ